MSAIGELKNKLNNGGYAYGTMVSIFDTPDIVRILKNSGMEWFFYDTEHGYPNVDRMNAIFAYARMVGLPALLRIPEINRTQVQRAMDMGVDGLVCPDVKTPAEARDLIRYAKYAPMGERGVSMTRPHTGFTSVDAPAYMEQANKDTMMIVQMESEEGIDNLDEILSIEGIDGVIVGPNDLSQSMGIPGQLDHPRFLSYVDKVYDVCNKHGKYIGMTSKSMQKLNQWRDKGAQLLQWSSDAALLTKMIRSHLIG